MRKELFNISKHLCVLYVEDDLETQAQYEKIFSVLFKEVKTAENGQKALEFYNEKKYDLIITDLTMPIMDGIALIGEVLKINPKQHIIVMTAHNSGESLRSSINFQIDGILLKPVAVDKLFTLLYKVCSTIKVENKEDFTRCSSDGSLKNLIYDDKSVLFLVVIDKFKEIVEEFGENAKEAILKTVNEHLGFFGIENGCLVKLEQGIIIYVVEKNYLKEIMGSLQDFSYRHNTLISEFDKFKLHINLFYGMIFSSKENSLSSKSCKFLLDYIDDILDDLKVNNECVYVLDIESESEINKKDESLRWLETTVEALEQKTMIPFYQPIISLETNQIASYEVYYRIKYGTEYILPEFFVPMSEKAGIIEDISKAVFDKAFKRFSFTNFTFHINLSDANLRSAAMKNYIIYLSSKYAIGANKIVLNIIDGEKLTINSKSLDTLFAFKKLGYNVVLKGFGVSNINLEMLMILEPEYIRINQSLIKRARKNEKARSLLTFFMNYTKEAGIKTILVGVEEQAVLDEGRKFGFDYAEGFLLGRPSENLIDK